uniref:Uncharacterized protein n=1 Tax=Physcomitrium patens TaxID=3218 RepID=A0A2K1KIV1_PHYPA|nr:hypothetical protein PHYPA_007382 [Physcomitrium patens]
MTAAGNACEDCFTPGPMDDFGFTQLPTPGTLDLPQDRSSKNVSCQPKATGGWLVVVEGSCAWGDSSKGFLPCELGVMSKAALHSTKSSPYSINRLAKLETMFSSLEVP